MGREYYDKNLHQISIEHGGFHTKCKKYSFIMKHIKKISFCNSQLNCQFIDYQSVHFESVISSF